MRKLWNVCRPILFSTPMVAYGFTLGYVADFGNENCLPAQNLIWNTKLNVNREARHIAKRVLGVRLYILIINKFKNENNKIQSNR